MALTLVLGGIRSGKSRFAEQMVTDVPIYIATARASDTEMADRIERHQRHRPAGWPVLEATKRVAEVLNQTYPDAQTVLLDGFGLLVGAAFDTADPVAAVRSEVEAIIADSQLRDWIVVSDETGLSLVSANAAGRHFQDLLGEANQWLSAAAENAYLVVAGRAVPLIAPRQARSFP